MVTLALLALAASVAVLAVTAAVSRRLGRYSVVDVAWGLAFAAIAITVDLAGHGTPWRRTLLVTLVIIWGVRLAWHIGSRQRGHGEDPRYQALMAGQGFGTALWKVFGLQAVLAWVVSAPVIGGAGTTVRWTWVAVAGALVWAVGLAFEAIGDSQLAAYKADPHRGPIMDRGLWGWTRHPNYFGDACVWWGLWLVGGLASGWLVGLATVIGPILMTHLLRNVSGAALLEQTMSRRAGWAEYAERVPMFFPRPPRRRKTA